MCVQHVWLACHLTLGNSSSCALQPLHNTTPNALYHSWLKLRLPHEVQPLIAGGPDIGPIQHSVLPDTTGAVLLCAQEC